MTQLTRSVIQPFISSFSIWSIFSLPNISYIIKKFYCKLIVRNFFITWRIRTRIFVFSFGIYVLFVQICCHTVFTNWMKTKIPVNELLYLVHGKTATAFGTNGSLIIILVIFFRLLFILEKRIHEVDIFFFLFWLKLFYFNWWLIIFSIRHLIFFLREYTIKCRKRLFFFVCICNLFEWVAILIAMLFFDLFDIFIIYRFIFILRFKLIWRNVITMVLVFITIWKEGLYFLFGKLQLSEDKLIYTNKLLWDCFLK